MIPVMRNLVASAIVGMLYAQLEELAASAPEEIDDDITRIARAAKTIEDAGDDPDAIAGLTDELADLEASTARVEAYLQDRCGIDSRPTDTTTS
jgi:hypothetical protein